MTGCLRSPLRASLLLGGTLIAQVANAASTNPTQAEICTDGTVDREKLAIFVLDKQAVSHKLTQWAVDHPDPRFKTVAQRIVADENICAVSGLCGSGPSNLSQAQSTVEELLKDNRGFDNPRRVTDIAAFFSDPAVVVGCRTLAGKPIEMVGAGTAAYRYKFPLRVRGVADALIFPRDTSDFKAADKATLSFTDDDQAGKRTTKITAIAGYPFVLRDGPVQGGQDFGELIPYAGLSRNVSRNDGQAKSVTTDNYRVGAVLSYRADRLLPVNAIVPISHYMIARPEYLFNDKDKSEIASLNLTYMPVINTFRGLSLNAYSRFDPDKADFFSFRPIFDLRFNNGTFTTRGTRAPEDARDFSRLGFQFGLAISHDNENLPIDLTVTRSYLFALAGEPDTIGQFKSTLSFSPDPKRYFGFDISYVRGRREDLADREEQWTIGIGVKY